MKSEQVKWVAKPNQVYDESTGETVCVIPGVRSNDPIAPNTALIAASPELLEACVSLFGLVESGHLMRDISGDAQPGWALKELGLVKALAQAREAIAHATGSEVCK